MDGSVLKETIDALGLNPNDDSFNAELKLHINSSLSTMYQNGIGTPFQIESEEEVWSNFLKESQSNQNEYMLGQVKSFVYFKTKLMFDPPPPSVVEQMVKAGDEMLWRLREQYDILEEV